MSYERGERIALRASAFILVALLFGVAFSFARDRIVEYEGPQRSISEATEAIDEMSEGMIDDLCPEVRRKVSSGDWTLTDDSPLRRCLD